MPTAMCRPVGVQVIKRTFGNTNEGNSKMCFAFCVCFWFSFRFSFLLCVWSRTKKTEFFVEDCEKILNLRVTANFVHEQNE